MTIRFIFTVPFTVCACTCATPTAIRMVKHVESVRMQRSDSATNWECDIRLGTLGKKTVDNACITLQDNETAGFVIAES